MKKVTISSKCIKNPWIYRIDKQANSTTETVPLNKNIHCRASFYHSRQLCRSMNPKHAKPSFGALGPTKHWGRKGRVYSIKLLIYPHSNIGDTSFMVAKKTTEALTSPPFLHILQCLVSALLIGKTCTLSTCCFFHLR